MSALPSAGITAQWFFTAPLERIATRRGDPLGFRASANRFADVLAPGLSNRTVDARWLTLLCWALDRSRSAWDVHGLGSLHRQDATRDFYDWLRPLELLWVARTLKLAPSSAGRQLPGRRAIQPCLGENARLDSMFGLSVSQFQRYRFSGIYGAYRSALRMLPGLTNGDGWSLGPVGEQLATYCHRQLRLSDSPLPKKRKVPNQARYWLHEGWPEWSLEAARDFFPESWQAVQRLPPSEAKHLCIALFGSAGTPGETGDNTAFRRSRTAEVLAESPATDYPSLCGHLEEHLSSRFDHQLDALGAFSRLADAGMAAMNHVWLLFSDGVQGRKPSLSVSDIAGDRRLKASLRRLEEASREFARRARQKPHHDLQTAIALSESVLGAKRSLSETLLVLLNHHEQYGDGRRWLTVDAGLVHPGAPVREAEGAPYRMRLHALARLAVQSGKLSRMPAALQWTDDVADVDQEEGDKP